MYRRIFQAFSVASLLASASAVYTLDALSFGHSGRLSPSNNGQVPGWDLTGEGHVPDLLSDRIILTPPSPGNRRGGLWSQKALDQSSWTVDFDFRATGPERGYGSLLVWLTQDGSQTVGLSSIYTAPKFDGLAIVVDQYGGQGGSVRGFLNDATVSYKTHHDVDSLAFGKCNYAFRNRGIFTRMQIKQLPDRFQVVVDDVICFESGKIQLPSGYYFGITAASAENPDSFEVSKFITSAVESNDYRRQPPVPPQGQNEPPPPSDQQQQQNFDASQASNQPIPNDDNVKISKEQYNDLRNRLSVIDRQVNNIFREVSLIRGIYDQKHEEVLSRLRQNMDALNSIDRMNYKINQLVQTVKTDVEGRDYQEHLSSLQDSLQETKAALSSHLPNTIKTIIKASVPSLGVFVFIVLGFQGLLAASYFVYKRRRANAPKKYL